MQEDFHYYATYCAAYLAGYSHEESMQICYAAQFVDCCSQTLLSKLKGPKAAATTQLQAELMNTRTDVIGIQNITRIWASFHFLPYDLYASLPKRSKHYMNKYRLICNTNGNLVVDTVKLAKGKSLQAAGVAMHVLADTWAHRYFAGIPSFVINNTNYYFYELIEQERPIKFRHNPVAKDDIEAGIYTNSVYQVDESAVMNLGHGRAGHLPDYSYIRYKYLPAWGNYEVIIKDNPSDFYHAFSQMVYALKFLKGTNADFEKETYDTKALEKYEDRIWTILRKRQLDACEDWKKFGEELSGQMIEPFDISKYQQDYIETPKQDRDDTFLGRFFLAAMAQKSMVTNKIFKSGNLLAGFSVDYEQFGFKGIKDFKKLIEFERENP